MTILLPRLPAAAADRLLDQMFPAGSFKWQEFNPDCLPGEVRYAATGGTVIQPARLKRLREEIVELAIECGFGRTGIPADHSRFDMELGQWSVSCPELDSGEALRDDVWTFMTTVMAPDVVYWRFGAARTRYLGGIRNAFQRTWIRAVTLDHGDGHPDRWELLRELTEDALVQITERPSIGANPVIARALGEGWVRAAARYGKHRMEDIMRLATLRLRIRNEIRVLSFLSKQSLAAFVDAEFSCAAAEILGGSTGIASSTQESINMATNRNREYASVSGICV